MYKLYIFDLDGTLLDSDRMLLETFRELYKDFRPNYFPSDEHIYSFSGPQITETLRKEFPDLDQKFMLEKYREYSTKNYDKYVTLYPGAYELLKNMKNKGINFAIVTNKHRYATNYSYKICGVEDLDIFTVCADEVKHLKPRGDGILQCLVHFGITDKHEVIYIGDGQIDYETAQNAGVDFGYVTWSKRKVNKEAKIDLTIDSYPSFAGEIL